jgi:hypothetical protein
MMQRGAAVALLLVASCSGGQGQVICPAGTRPMYGTTMQERYSVPGNTSSVDFCVACDPGHFREPPGSLLVTDTVCELCPIGKTSGGGGAPCEDCVAPLSVVPHTINGVVFERSACNGARNVSRFWGFTRAPRGYTHDQPLPRHRLFVECYAIRPALGTGCFSTMLAKSPRDTSCARTCTITVARGAVAPRATHATQTLAACR